MALDGATPEGALTEPHPAAFPGDEGALCTAAPDVLPAHDLRS
ncbi:hypothetical protein P9869_19305 [Streptomyces ossamyceticus]|nr:hypothetical protein [Streptomyces ossamyceticus]